MHNNDAFVQKQDSIESMSYPASTYATIDEWTAKESISFSVDSPKIFKDAVDKVMASLDDSVELLGFGEALHGGEDILRLRNRLFQRLVEAHGYSSIALESSFPRAHLVNEYVLGRCPKSYQALQDAGFSHGFGRLGANRELVEWMRKYNADPAHGIKIQFYAFDSPTEMTSTDSPAQVLHFVLDYLASIEDSSGKEHREWIDSLLGQNSDWENPQAMMDPTKSIGMSPAANALRIQTENLISELCLRRPELVAKSDKWRFLEAFHYARVAQQLLNYHAQLAQDSGHRTARLLGIRDAMMADNLAYIMSREHGRGKVMAFAHNSHLQRGKAQWQLGADTLTWWPAGAHMKAMFGSRYAVIGTALGVSEVNGIGEPLAGTLEARLRVVPGPVRFIPTHEGQALPASKIGSLSIRSGSTKNSTYFALTPQSLTDFDWLAILD